MKKLKIFICLTIICQLQIVNYKLFAQSVGIGSSTFTPGSMLSVAGGVSVGTYSTTAAPTNGLIVSGNVGVGSSSPAYQLDLYNSQNASTLIGIQNPTSGTAALSGIISRNNTGGAGAIFGSTSSAYTTIAILQNRLIIDANSNLGGIAINNEGAQPIVFGVSNAEKMRVHTDGNIGIGTTSPGTNAKLHVYGDAVTGGTNANISAGSGQGTANILGTWVNAASTGFAQFSVNATYSGSAWSTINSGYDCWSTSMKSTSGSIGAFSIYHGTAAATPTFTEYFTILATNGNVGIGSSSPAQKLDVTGNIAASGDQTVGGDITISGGELNGNINTQWLQSQIDGGYNVGLSTLRYSGIHGVTFWGAYNAGPDLAERYQSTENLEPGTVVSWDTQHALSIISSQSTSDQFGIAGVISSNPGIILSDLTGYDSSGYALALTGRVPIKISNENGTVFTGDPLTVSKKYPGMAMKATSACRIIGTALEAFDGTISLSENVYKHLIKPNTHPAPFQAQASIDGTGKIMMFVKVEWYTPTLDK